MKRILINENPWQTRVAILSGTDLQNIYFSTNMGENLERAYFKGVVTNILPGIQTAFVEFDATPGSRAGFLHISEIDREMAIDRMAGGGNFDVEDEASEKKERPSRVRPDITKILREGEAVLVQVCKEPVYEKGAKLTTCFTLPGRFVVLMPNIPRIAISKKIDSREDRQRLRELLSKHLPEGMGAIIRTASGSNTDAQIVQDLDYLIQLWQSIQKKYASAGQCERIYEDLPMPLQVVRDNLDDDVEQIICDNAASFSNVYKFVKMIAPEHAHKVVKSNSASPLFELYEVERQIEQALLNKVHLRSGGSLIIETTQAMTVIDVNTGRFAGGESMEDTILKTNLEAAEEIVRQLRLRNIGGLIVIDFIDMESHANRQKLYRHIEKTLKEKDKFQSVVLRVSEFGLVQMTRKRSGRTLMQQLMATCSTCKGLGMCKTIKTDAYTVLRHVQGEIENKKQGNKLDLYVHQELFTYITAHEYTTLLSLEKEYGKQLTLHAVNDSPSRTAYRLVAH
jgi:ribonuclease G